MAETFTRRDRETSRQAHRLFLRAMFTAWPDLLVWALTRPLAVVVYNVFIPIEIAYGIQAIVTGHFSSVQHYAVTIMLLAILYCVLWTIGGIAICRNGRVDLTYVQRKVFDNYLHKDYEFFSNVYLGALGTQATKLRDTMTDYSQLMLNGFGQQTVVILSSIAIIAYHSWLLAVVTIVALLFVFSFTIWFSRWRLKYRQQLSQASSDTAGVIGDALGHGMTVKSFAAENYETARLDVVLNKFIDIQYSTWMTSIPADVVRLILAAAATAVLLVLTAHLYQDHKISIAIVALIQLYVIRLITATQTIADLIKTYETTMSNAHQAVKTMLVKPTIVDPDKPVRMPAKNLSAVFHNVSFSYDEGTNNSFAIQKFNLELQTGEKIGLVGYSGSGKTTLTKLLLRFLDVNKGSITINGTDIRDVRQEDLRRQIAYVPQEPMLFHRTIAENISYGKPAASKAAIVAAAKAAYTDDFTEKLPNKYDTLVGERGIKLSGGQRQRVAIARAILKDSPILVLDEATSALDSRSEKLIQKALWRLMKGRTALVIAHRLSTVQHMDRIVVMDKGRIVQIGTHEELLRDATSIYAGLWSHQSGGYFGASPNENPSRSLDELR